MEIGCGPSYADGSWVAGEIDGQVVNIDDQSLVKDICVPILLRVSFFFI
jgi:hypothetical protein